GKNNHKYIIASCCNPIPGDPVIGFKALDGSITVHKKTCAIADDIASKHGEMVVIPKWEESAIAHTFPVRVTLKGLDRVGIVNEITRYMSLVMGVNIKKIYLGTEDEVFEGYLEFYVHDKATLDSIMKKLALIEGIQTVSRTDM
ncbi:MAG: hypothetical protein MJZ16_12190, partial [Bacteroidales bacterium]|nr:hypothetical protein [Bacteroidales bacterium]